MSPRSGIVGKTYFYLENGYGVELINVHIKNLDLHPNVVVSVDRRAMFI
jgi:hypothetical protein